MATVTVPPPPKTELGVTTPTPLASWGLLGGNSTGVGVLVDDIEKVDALRWPLSVRDTYPAMRNDTQLTALLRGTVLSIGRFVWGIDDNGARPDLVNRICADYNLLPIDDAVTLRATGRSPRPIGRGANRFSFNDHRRLALDAVWLGHAYFNQVYPVGADGLVHVRKLAPRPQSSITEIDIAEDGGLVAIKQQIGLEPAVIPVDALVAYVWDQAPGNWFGRSMFRPCYREWLIKDRLIRVDAANHERLGGTIILEAQPDATDAQRAELAGMATQIRVGLNGGGAVPNGVKPHLLAAASGPTTIDSINRHDEAMARAWLMMVIQLGTTQTGSRALGSEFGDLKDESDEAIAFWFRDVFNEHVIEDDVDWNEGPGEEFVPRLICLRPEAPAPTAASALPGVTVDPATQALLDGQPAAVVAELRAKVRRQDREYRARLEQALPDLFTSDELRALASLADADEETTELLDQTLSSRTRPAAHAATTSSLPLPARKLRRQPYDHEVRAAVDFAALDRAWVTELDTLIGSWAAVRRSQADDLRKQIEAANGDLEALAAVQATRAGDDLIRPVLERAAAQAAAEAVAEAKRQGVLDATTPSLDEAAAALDMRSTAVAELLSRSLSEAAGRRAVQLSGGGLAAAEVADDVTAYLDGLSDAYLRDQFGGAIVAAQNTGRITAMRGLPPARYYASELLDVNCCQPCVAEDGTEFDSLDDATRAYPTGGYKGCQGGPRCRGTVVAVYDEAAPST